MMADPAFRAQQHRDRYAPHIRPINELVDELRKQGAEWLPYVAPLHGGINATVLTVLRDPGPATQVDSGSGFLCTENDDATAEQQATGFAAAGIAPGDVTPWNAYPWYINAKPTAAQLEAGVEPLLRLMALMPHLRTVLLQGGEAKAAWRRVLRRQPSLAGERRLQVISTYHPGRQALWSPDAKERARRRQERVNAYGRVAASLSQQ
jgi:hypothetical protein